MTKPDKKGKTPHNVSQGFFEAVNLCYFGLQTEQDAVLVGLQATRKIRVTWTHEFMVEVEQSESRGPNGPGRK